MAVLHEKSVKWRGKRRVSFFFTPPRSDDPLYVDFSLDVLFAVLQCKIQDVKEEQRKENSIALTISGLDFFISSDTTADEQSSWEGSNFIQ